MARSTIEIGIADKTFTFHVSIEADHDTGAPWENADDHGTVSEWTRRSKRAGELVLNSSRGGKRYYDFAEACRIALRDGWDHVESRVEGETKRQKAARAALADFEYLRSWCNDQWRYVGVVVTLLDDDGEPTDIVNTLWGVEDRDPDYVAEVARNLADELAGGYGVRWGEVTKTTYALFEAQA